jgi:hypothetical protein
MSAIVVSTDNERNASPHAKYYRGYLIGANVAAIIVFVAVIIALHVSYNNSCTALNKAYDGYNAAGTGVTAACALGSVLLWIITVCLIGNIIVCLFGVAAGWTQNIGLITCYMITMTIAFLEVIGLTSSVASRSHSAGAIVGCVFMLLFMFSLIVTSYMCRKVYQDTQIIYVQQPQSVMYVQQPMISPGYQQPVMYGATGPAPQVYGVPPQQKSVQPVV